MKLALTLSILLLAVPSLNAEQQSILKQSNEPTLAVPAEESIIAPLPTPAPKNQTTVTDYPIVEAVDDVLSLPSRSQIGVSIRFVSDVPVRENRKHPVLIVSQPEQGLCATLVDVRTVCSPQLTCVREVGVFGRVRDVEKCVYDCTSTAVFKMGRASEGDLLVQAIDNRILNRARGTVLAESVVPVRIQ